MSNRGGFQKQDDAKRVRTLRSMNSGT